jgi:hypothetical protein
VTEKRCSHKKTSIRYSFTPSDKTKVMAITYCKECGDELSREPLSTSAADRRKEEKKK